MLEFPTGYVGKPYFIPLLGVCGAAVNLENLKEFWHNPETPTVMGKPEMELNT